MNLFFVISKFSGLSLASVIFSIGQDLVEGRLGFPSSKPRNAQSTFGSYKGRPTGDEIHHGKHETLLSKSSAWLGLLCNNLDCVVHIKHSDTHHSTIARNNIPISFASKTNCFDQFPPKSPINENQPPDWLPC